MSNLGLYMSLEREGIDYEQTAVGDKYVAENMMENNYSIGGEQSGHIIFSRYSATGDGILTSLMIMEACVDQKATLCDLAKEMKVYPQLLRNVRVSDKKTALENEKVKAAIERTRVTSAPHLRRNAAASKVRTPALVVKLLVSIMIPA